MRSRATTGILLLALIGVALILAGGSGPGGSYRAAAVFDTADGIVPGQLVKIAGARVGSVDAVKLLPGPHARIEFSVNRRFGPFHTDARCRILPEGLISENYVECDPGSPGRPALAGDGIPTVPLSRTTVPVSLQDVINIFSLPVGQRLAVLIDELGIGTAGRGTDVNAILRRANPALTDGDRVLSILNSQNRRLAAAVSDMHGVLARLAGGRRAVRSFVSRAAVVAGTAARHRAALAASVRRLPPLLGALRENLSPVDRVAADGAPLLVSLRAAAPGLLELTRVLPAFARQGRPAIAALAGAATRGSSAVVAATPVVTQLRRLAATAPSVLGLASQLLVSSRDSGAFEGLLRLLYSLSTDAGAYDSISHFVTALIIPFPACLGAPSTAGCSHAYTAPGQGSVPINGAASAARDPATLKPLLNFLLK